MRSQTAMLSAMIAHQAMASVAYVDQPAEPKPEPARAEVIDIPESEDVDLHTILLARLSPRLRGCTAQALDDSFMWKEQVDARKGAMGAPKNGIANTQFAIAVLHELGYRWRVMETLDGFAVELRPAVPMAKRPAQDWRKVNIESLRQLAEAIGVDVAGKKKLALNDVITASAYKLNSVSELGYPTLVFELVRKYPNAV